MSRNSVEMQTENSIFPPPPPYTSVIYKSNEEASWENYPPPTYSDVDQLSSPNNYPGPPLTDGCVQIVPADSSVVVSPPRQITKKLRIFLLINGLITLLCAFAAIGLQIGLIVTKSILYYYYGFWAGALIFSVGINTLMLIHHSRHFDLPRWIRSYFWESMLIAVVFIIGIVIIATDQCNDNGTDDDGNSSTPPRSSNCRPTNRILMGIIIGTVGVTMFQTVLSTLFFRNLYKQLPRNFPVTLSSSSPSS